MQTKRVQLAALALFLTAAAANLLATFTSQAVAPNGLTFKKLLDASERLSAQATRLHRLSKASAGKLYSLTASLPAPAALAAQDTLTVTLRDGQRTIASKALHQGDPDLYTLFRVSSEASLEITSQAQTAIQTSLTVLEWPENKADKTSAEAEPNDAWNEANEFQLGQTVWAAADDKPYITPLSEKPLNKGAIPYAQQPELTQDRLPEGGVDWFKFNYDGAQPKLVHFELDLLERDNIPVDVSIFTVENNEVKAYERGADPVTPPHEVQALPGNKFTTRILTKGAYYVRVDANHPFYQLRTSVYDVPPYNDPRQAVRAGMDYLVSSGDSWHANTPRHGGLVTRVSSTHHETQLCIACHATHFTTRGELTAAANGYAVNKRWALQFLTERLANNPRPFYGYPEASWTNVISASANVMSRLAALVNNYDQQFTGEKRLSLLKSVAGYLQLYYRDRTQLPNDESNGNTPLVSTYEVAWYSWRVFDELYKLTNEAEYRNYREQIRKLLEQDKIKNNVDLCYQISALAEIDKTAYAERLKRNAERLLSLQRADGQWSMLFDKDSPSVEFQTYHSLYALAVAGYAPEHPQIARSLKFLLDRQQEWGGWFDPKQSYENFRTPFRETQFAVMALSEFYKGSEGKGWRTAVPQSLSKSDAALRLQQIDNIWSPPSVQLHSDLLVDLTSAEPLLRAAAAAVLGRTRRHEAIALLTQLLGDRSKLVQIAAAQALRRIASVSRAPTLGGSGVLRAPLPPKSGITNTIITALDSRDERTRWGATRIFAQHFKDLTDDHVVGEKLIAMLADPYAPVRMQAAKSLVRWYYWTKDEALQDRIADAFIARMAVNEHPWVRRNLLENFYSLADENVRYLYNNWIGHLAQQEDRDRATEGHRRASRKMAERAARALEIGNEMQREGLLRGLTEFHLRTGGYANAGRYSRIGNDVETVVFYADGAPVLAKALSPLLNAPDAARRQQALVAAYTLRDNTLPQLPLLVMQRLTDADAQVRAAAAEFYRALPLKVVEANRVEAIKVLRELLASQFPEAQVAALDRLKTLGAERAQFDAEVKSFVLKADAKVAPATLRALADFLHLANDEAVQQRLAAALQSNNDNLLRAALQLVFAAPSIRALPNIAAAFDATLKTAAPAQRKLILDLLQPEMPVNDDLRVIGLLAEALADPEESVRAAALNAVRRLKAVQGNAAIRAGLAKLTRDPNQRLQGLAIAIYQGQDGNLALDLRAEELLDYNYFAARVLPLLARKGADGNACVNCHDTHTLLRLVKPDASGRFSDEQVRENYRSALRVVDLANPENSLLLRKPIGDAAQEGLIGSGKTPHGGGPRWAEGRNDAAYQVVLEWINGAKLKAASK